MASNYTDLQAEILSWMARTGDSDLTSKAPDFIAFAEARLNRELPLRVMETDTTLTGTTSSRELALPTDFVEPIALHLTTYGDQRWLRPFIAGSGPLMSYHTTNGVPCAWTINGENIDLDTPCDQAHTFTFRYRQSFALATTDPNWLLTNQPDLYLAASLVEAYQFQKNAEAVSLWEQRYQESKRQVIKVNGRSKGIARLVVDRGLRSVGGFDINSGDFR